MARKKADKIFDYPCRLSKIIGEEIYLEAQKDRQRLGRPVPLGEVIERVWLAHKGKPAPKEQEDDTVVRLRELLKDEELGGQVRSFVQTMYDVLRLKRADRH